MRHLEVPHRACRVQVEPPALHKVERLAEVLADPRNRDEAADAIRGLIERIVLTPGEKRGEMHAALHGDLGTILDWAGGGTGKDATDTPRSGMPALIW